MGINPLSTLTGALAVGLVSAVIPVLNAELFLAAVASIATATLSMTAAVALAAGQTAGKCVVFGAARRSHRWAIGRRQRSTPRVVNVLRRHAFRVADTRLWRGTERPRAWLCARTARALTLLDRPWPAAAVVLASASVGLPPLGATAVAAGVKGTKAVLFAGCTFVGRTARFAVIAWAGTAVLP